ncbi:MAG TPA: glycosyltransferase, partial [Candidatus Tenderia sp.]|nr:glycosyltransferase [Candidatus Tenderia sp.]
MKVQEEKPRISIITATWNAGRTLGDCLQSVARQGVAAEHLVIDGASTDNTLQVIEAHRDTVAQVISEPDEGIYDAMNKGIALAHSEVVGILNADDFYASSDVLERVLACFEDPSVDACYGDLRYVDFDDPQRTVRFWRSGDFRPERFYRGWMPPHPTFFVRRLVYERFGGFNTGLGSAADYEIMLRFLLRHRIRAVYLPKVLVHMRTGGVSNASTRN